MSKSGEWREQVRQVGLDLLYVSAFVLIVVDLFEPSLRVGRLGSSMLLVAIGISMRWLILRKLSRAWGAGERAGRRHRELEEAAEPQLSVVRDVARP